MFLPTCVRRFSSGHTEFCTAPLVVRGGGGAVPGRGSGSASPLVTAELPPQDELPLLLSLDFGAVLVSALA